MLLSLEAWLAQTYAPGSEPSRVTVWRWIREGKIAPMPQKQGRAYYFKAEARYKDGTRLVERI
jgi:predicted site-specific integrase-resolvase